MNSSLRAAVSSGRFACGRLATTEGITSARYYCFTRLHTKASGANKAESNNKTTKQKNQKKKKAPSSAKPTTTTTPMPSLPPLFDADANITHEIFSNNAQEVLVTARRAGVHAAMVPGTTVDDSKRAIELIRTLATSQTPVSLFTCSGVHPYCVTAEQAEEDGKSLGKDIELLREMYKANDDIVVAIGECGLDYSDGFPDRLVQLPVFRAQVALACDLQVPLFMHERAAHVDFLAVVDEFKDRQLPKVLVHCFTVSYLSRLADDSG
jgi:Tat protein secretion system quality control protein TatD with DNase activity